MDGKVKGGGKDELSKEVEQNAKAELAESIRRSQEGAVDHAEPNHSAEVKVEDAKPIRQVDGKVEQAETPKCNLKDEEVKHAESNSKPSGIKPEGTESNSSQSKIGDTAEPAGRRKAGKVGKAESTQGAKHQPARKKFNKSRASGVEKFKGRFKSFGETAKKFWDVWSRFKTKTTQNPKPSMREKTLGVPGFEEIACIEAEVPDIMMMDKDRVRTSCKECMRDEPAFPSKEQIKAKLIAADKYYGVKSEKTKSEQSDSLEHEADYYDTDGSVVRPSWRFILERPLVEQYVLMTNYIRKVSVLSELKDNKASKKFIEEEDSGSDTEYKKFEQKFIREKRELLKPMQKPKTQDMAVQTSFEPRRDTGEDLKESVSEISLYPESEESTDLPHASAVTIVTSRDYASPLQSDFDGRTTDKSASFKGEKWWESHGTCEPSESFQTSYDSIKNTSSGSDGQYVPVHYALGNTALQSARETFSNESDSRIVPHNRSVEPSTHKKPKDSKKVSFSPVVTYYQGPNMTSALYNVVECQGIGTETDLAEPQQGMETVNPEENQQTANNAQDHTLSTEEKIPETLPSNQTEEEPTNKEELPDETPAVRPKRPNRKVPLENILQDKKRGQIVSVSVPADWHEDRILRNEKMVTVAVSRSPMGHQPVTKRLSFQEYEEIPDVEYSNPDVSTVKDKTDANIQTQTTVAQTSIGKFYPAKHRESPPSKQALDNKRNPRKSKIQATGDPENVLVNRNVKLNPPGRHWYGEIKSTGTETHIRTALRRQTQLETRLETNGTTDQRFDGQETVPMILDRASTPGATVQPLSFLNNDVYTHAKTNLRENNVYSQPKTEGTDILHARNTKEAHKRPSINPDQKPIPRIPPSPQVAQVESRQQHSTDTEGPSSSSNEHIKLKASPPCFFKVATPPDLSRISVDEFYPDVPEIDAEISQTSEIKPASAPQVEIVFANRESALRYIQDAEFHRVSRKEENTMLQKSVKTTQIDSPIILNAPNKGKTIIASAGVGIKIAEDIEISKDKGQDKSRNIVISKTPTKDSSQQSTITQNLGKSSLMGKSLIESEGEHIKPKICQTKSCKTDFGSPAKTQEQSKDHKRVKLEEAEQTAQQLLEDKDMKSRRNVKINLTTEPAYISHVSAAPHRSMQASGLPNKGEETKPNKNVVNEKSEIGKEHREIEKSDKMEERETSIHDEDDETITLQRQLDTNSTGPQLMPQGRTKLYMRTLSSLAEETSSMIKSTSSTQEKHIDMPTVERPVEELRTIFEKPVVSSVSGESEIQVEGNHSDLKKCVGSSKQLDNTFGKLVVSNEMIMTTNDSNMAEIKHSRHKSDGKLIKPGGEETINSQGHLPPVEPNATGSNQAKQGHAQAEKPIKSDNALGGRDSKHGSALTEEESSIQQLSQIEVIRASEIYSNTSMHFSSSEDRGVKLTKARTGFQPVTLDDDLACSASCRETQRSPSDEPGGPKETHLEAKKSVTSKEEFSGKADGKTQVNTDPQQKKQGRQLKTNHEGDNSSVGQGMGRILAGKENGETEETPQAKDHPSKTPTGTDTEKVDANLSDPIAKAMSGTDEPAEPKHWLMDVIPVLSKNTRYRGFRPHKPICVKEATEAEALKYKQDAVKPVFRFLKKQREME